MEKNKKNLPVVDYEKRACREGAARFLAIYKGVAELKEKGSKEGGKKS